MRDYLEELMDGAGALLEELRKAERGLSGMTGPEGGAGPPSGEGTEPAHRSSEAVLFSEKPARPAEGAADRAENAGEIPEEQGEKIVNGTERTEDEPKALRRQDGEQGDGGTRRAPLEVRLEQLDRAAASADGAVFRQKSGTETREKFSDQARRGAVPVLDPEEAEKTRMGGLGGLSASGREGDWVEQADQAFRRDSRRYDGGFYLY